MKAELTYNAGQTYRVKGYQFKNGRTVICTDPNVIKRCQATAGFSVRILDATVPRKKRKPRKAVMQPIEREVRDVSSIEISDKPKRSTRKKVSDE